MATRNNGIESSVAAWNERAFLDVLSSSKNYKAKVNGTIAKWNARTDDMDSLVHYRKD
ncbi:hypothetical protein [uncultured Bifidobacterium sp.]|uniref:hypothetical protein n=1 Tax=uncultured Bifidobacterium sp. TaxID=165187 RepID=UPI00259076E5|nr:hypothetical protein [uncultured Bifidobacterium sp.]